MSKVLNIQAPDGSMLKVEGPASATDEQFLQQAGVLFQQQQSIKEAQAAKYPTAAEQGGKPGSITPPESHLGMNMQTSGMGADILSGLSKLGHALWSAPQGLPPGTQPNLTGTTIHDRTDANVPTAVSGDAPLADAFLGAGGTSTIIPSATRAAGMFDKVGAIANDIPIDPTEAEQIAARAQELGQRGNTLPKVIRDFVKARKPGDFMGQEVNSPMTYEVGRDFASKAGSLSAQEAAQINKTPMQAQVAKFAGALKDANRDAAASVGMGDLYDQAMREYRAAKTLASQVNVIKKYGLQVAITTGLGLGAYKLITDLWSPRKP